MKCWKCKRSEYSPSRRNKLERLLTYVLPFRPYRCDSCDFRFYGPMSPLFNRSRAISAGVLGVVLLLFIVSFFIPSGKADAPPLEDNQVAEKVAQPEDTEMEELLANAPAFPPEENQPVGDEQSVEIDGPSLEQNSKPMEEPEIVEDLSGHSDFVKAQLAKNLSKAAGENHPTVIHKEDDASKPAPALKKKSTASEKRAVAGGGTIQSVEIKAEVNTFLLELETSQPVSVRGEWLDSKTPKFVVNIRGDWSLKKGLKMNTPIQASFVKKVRMGRHPGYFTIVLDLNTNEIAKPQVESRNNRLVIELARL